MSEEKQQEPTKNVDLGAAGRGVWLVKVPKYLSQRWQKAPGNGDVGKLKITRSKFPGQKPEVVFTLNEPLTKPAPGELPCPQEHKMVLTGLGSQNLVVFSTAPDKVIDGDEEAMEIAISDKVAIEGKVIQRAECRPNANDSYLKLKRLEMERSNKPKREVKQISTVVPTYRPVKDHSFNIEHNQRLKDQGKRLRADKDKVLEMLFGEFEKHQYYNIKDLVRITNQPITYLKEILKEICIYNMKAPHRNMWELKPEYRHYKEQAGT